MLICKWSSQLFEVLQKEKQWKSGSFSVKQVTACTTAHSILFVYWWYHSSNMVPKLLGFDFYFYFHKFVSLTIKTCIMYYSSVTDIYGYFASLFIFLKIMLPFHSSFTMEYPCLCVLWVRLHGFHVCMHVYTAYMVFDFYFMNHVKKILPAVIIQRQKTKIRLGRKTVQ